MSDMFSKKKWYISEEPGFSKLHEAYTLLDPEDGKKVLGKAIEEIKTFDKLKKLFLDRGLIPLHVRLNDENGQTLMTLDRKGCTWSTPIEVLDAKGNRIGAIRQAWFSLSGKLSLTGPAGESIGTIDADTCCGKKYTYVDGNGKQVGTITHQWKGYSREWLTTTDDWMVELTEDQTRAPLLLAGALAVDLLFHET
ncbi:MAG: hypothetical protein HQM09_03405 [Candidatus Riflebacteria bacterium]|nr:hypothetical protein [Candidatus Riflebacteria bacterium]